MNTTYTNIPTLSDLPEDADAFAVDDIINLDTEKLQTETTGEKIVRKLQEYLLQKDKPLEMAILPEDKIQRLLVGVTIFQ